MGYEATKPEHCGPKRGNGAYWGPVHGEFVLMQQLVFGISRGNVSANDNVSARRFRFRSLDRRFSLQPCMTAVLVVIVSESDQFHLKNPLPSRTTTGPIRGLREWRCWGQLTTSELGVVRGNMTETMSAEMALRYWLLTCSYGINYRKINLLSRTIMSRSRPTPPTAIPDRYAQRFRTLKQEFEQLEYFCKGTLLKRMMKCGKAQCACRHNPAKRHGPYFEWTYKAKGKTVNVKLTRDVMPAFRAASHQYRKLKSLLNRLETLSQTVLRHQAQLAQTADRH